MKRKSVEEIEAFLRPYAEELSLEIVEVKWEQKGTLHVTIDSESGVDLLLCEKFHRAIDSPLDELDPSFGEPYTLSCSSAGLDRPFQTERDYLRHLGEKIEIKLYASENGKKSFEGVLERIDGEGAVINTQEGERFFPFSKIAKACLFIEV